MTDPLEASGVRRICPRCGKLTDASARFCKTCGFGFVQGGAAGQENAPAIGAAANQVPTYAAAPERSNRSTLLAIAAAVVAGLVIGGILFYRIVGDHAQRSPVTKQSNAVIPAVSSESTPSAVKPPPEADALATKSLDVIPPIASAPKHKNEQAVVPISSVDTPPVLINNAPQTPAATPTPPVVPGTPAAPENAPAVSPARRPAMQEAEAEAAPVQSSPTSSQSVAANSPPANVPPAAGMVSSTPAPEPIRKPVYDGPMAGMATWTGKLEKNGTLTITGGTPSNGILSGAGLPGVPVRLTIDQTNLGFLEMPSAANGYRRLVLKSHSSHDKITIHWTVVQQ